MKLIFKQKFFSWFDSYNIFDENGNIYFKVQGKLSWGHMFNIYDKNNKLIGCLKEQVLRLLPHFTMIENGNKIGEIVKHISFLTPKFSISCSDWKIKGNFMEWNYSIIDSYDNTIATINKKLFNFTDTYELNIYNREDALKVLMITLSIDAIKCNQARNN